MPDLLMQRFFGSESLQAMRRALGSFGKGPQEEHHHPDSVDGLSGAEQASRTLQSNSSQAKQSGMLIWVFSNLSLPDFWISLLAGWDILLSKI